MSDLYENLSQKISDWIKKKVAESDSEGLVFGMSGGLDSSVLAVLCKKSGSDVLGLIMPCFADEKDIENAELIAKKFGIKTKMIDLTPVYYSLLEILPEGDKIARGNLKPRLRMLVLYYFANKYNYLVVGTGNKSELMAGYFTKYGDGGADIEPIGDLYKTQVKELAEELGLPKEIINQTPSAGLWEGQTDEAELGLSYDLLDKILAGIEKNQLEGFDPKMIEKVKNMIKGSEHKRKMPEVFEI